MVGNLPQILNAGNDEAVKDCDHYLMFCRPFVENDLLRKKANEICSEEMERWSVSNPDDMEVLNEEDLVMMPYGYNQKPRLARRQLASLHQVEVH